MMKKLYWTIALLLLFSLLSTAVILVLSPDVVPVHYNFLGEVDRFGSKYENLIFPGFGFLMTAIMLLLLKYQRKKMAPELEQRALLGVAVFSLALFNVLGIFFGVAAINYSGGVIAISPDAVIQHVSIATGIILMVFGNVMPKARRNAFFGIRTKWSMANDAVWRKSQRFGGISGVICGLLMTVLAVVVPGIWNLVVMTGLILIWVIGCVTASYIFWKEGQMPIDNAQPSP